ncbi:unnamed protein product [Aphanomyces euteiches]
MPAAAVITTEEYRYRIDELKLSIPVVYINAEDLATNPLVYSPSSENIASPEEEAYIVYTSGSTGKPKGVPVLHKGAVNTMMHGTIKFDLEGARMLQFFAIGFDGFQSDMWSALTQGATLVLRSDNDLDDLLSTIDVVAITPTGLSLLGDPDKYPRLRCVGVAGESVPASLRDLWADKVLLINCYGPSECSMGTHLEYISPGQAITIGNPFANVNSYVLDDRQRPVPIGVIGELYLGGVGVVPSYVNLPEETATRFLADPFTGGRMFRTGDVGRLLSNGKMEVLGRQDSQVKLKGYRIELDEVAEAIMQHPRVKNAAVIYKSKKHLVGYYSPSSVDSAELRQTVANILPSYMVPDVWIGLEDLPQNVNGKIDRKTLEAMEINLEIDALETEAEKQMAEIWAEVLNVPMTQIGRNTSFTSLGGDSVSIVKVVSSCRRAGISLSVAQILHESVLWLVAAIALKTRKYAVQPKVEVDEAIVHEIESSWSMKLHVKDFAVYPVTGTQGDMLQMSKLSSSLYTIQSTLKLSEDMTTNDVCGAFRSLLNSHEILRTTFAEVGSEMYQVIRSDADDFEIPIATVETLNTFLANDLARGFTFGEKYFVRFAIICESSNRERTAVFTMHHTLYDGWSYGMIIQDFWHAFIHKSVPSRPAFRSVVDYVEADASAAEQFWRAYMAPVQPVERIAFPEVQNALDAKDDLILSVDHNTILGSAKLIGVPLTIILQYAWACTWRKYSKRNAIAFVQTMANRTLPVPDADKIIGPLMNESPFRVRFDDVSLPIATQLRALYREEAKLTAHSHTSTSRIETWCGTPPGRTLCDTRFVYQNFPHMENSTSSGSPQFQVTTRNKELLQSVGIDTAAIEASQQSQFTYMIGIEVDGNNIVAKGVHDPAKMSSIQAEVILSEFDKTLLDILAATKA